MSLRSRELSALLSELNLLHDQPFRQFWRLAPQSYVLAVGAELLLLDFSRDHNWVGLMDAKPQALKPDALSMWVRKHFRGCVLRQIIQPPGERLWRLQWDNELEMICEWSGRHSNFFIVREGCIAQILRADASRRSLQVGGRYRPPEAPPQALERPVRWRLDTLPADGSRSQRLLEMRAHYLQKQWLTLQGQRVSRVIQRALKRKQAERDQLQTDLARLDESAFWQRRGELLQGAYGRVQKGQDTVQVVDFYDPEGGTVVIPLDPQRDLNGNIQRCYQRSQKAERAAERALERLDGVEAELKGLQQQWHDFLALHARLGAEDGEGDAEAFAQFQEYLDRWAPPQDSGSGSSSPRSERLPYHRFWAANGDEIRVGRSARDNDALSFRHARGRDAWLHVRDFPGSHVVVPVEKGKSLNEQSLLDAATLALHYSECHDDRAEITVSSVKFLKRIKAAPGQVQIQKSRTLFLRLEAPRLERLLATRNASQALEGRSI